MRERIGNIGETPQEAPAHHRGSEMRGGGAASCLGAALNVVVAHLEAHHRLDAHRLLNLQHEELVGRESPGHLRAQGRKPLRQ